MSDTVVNLPTPAPQRREIQTVVDAVPILDTARFEHMQRIANVLARSSMIPETLRTEGTKDNKVALPFEQVLSNCFLVVNQAARWGMDPFSVISCCSVVHGRLAYEGKLVAAVLEAKLGVHLIYEWDDKPNDLAGIKVSGTLPDGRNEYVLGTVSQWKTTGPGSPWLKQPRLQLAYRGAREWARLYAPGVMLGVYGEEEMDNLVEDARSRRATLIASLSDRLSASQAKGGDGFSQDHVERETRGVIQEFETEVQRAAGHKAAPPASLGDEPLAFGQAPESPGVAEVAAIEPASPTNSSQALISPDAETDRPATEESPLPEVAGDQSELSAAPPEPGNVEARAGDLGGETGPQPTLPQGWEITYAAALRRAQKKESLTRYATEYWKQYGGWATHKDGPNGPTAVAIYDAFANNFGNREQIEDVLRELF